MDDEEDYVKLNQALYRVIHECGKTTDIALRRLALSADFRYSQALYEALIKAKPELEDDAAFVLRISPKVTVHERDIFPN